MKALRRKLHLLVVALLFVVLATPCYAMSMPVTKPVDSMENFLAESVQRVIHGCPMLKTQPNIREGVPCPHNHLTISCKLGVVTAKAVTHQHINGETIKNA